MDIQTAVVLILFASFISAVVGWQRGAECQRRANKYDGL